MPANDRYCEDCSFFEKGLHAVEVKRRFVGACHAKSPRKDYTWPAVADDDWCGKFEPAPEDQADGKRETAAE